MRALAARRTAARCARMRTAKSQGPARATRVLDALDGRTADEVSRTYGVVREKWSAAARVPAAPPGCTATSRLGPRVPAGFDGKPVVGRPANVSAAVARAAHSRGKSHVRLPSVPNGPFGRAGHGGTFSTGDLACDK